MSDRSLNLHDSVTPTSNLPRRIPGASGHGKPLGPRPTLPKQRLTARPLPRDLAYMAWDDDDKPVIPKPAPRQRQPIDQAA